VRGTELQAAADLTKKKEVEAKQKAQVGTLGMSSLSELLDSLMEKEQAVQAQTKNKKMDNKMKQKLAYATPSQTHTPLAQPSGIDHTHVTHITTSTCAESV
jgi:hypothetical protein